MKRAFLFLSLIGVLFITSGCMNAIGGQKITIQMRTGEENIFEDFKEVTKRKQVKRAIHIVQNANWENENVEMERYADYQFQIPLKHRNGDDKIASYLLWISPTGEHVELMKDSDEYVKLTKQDSANLYEILTGEALIQ